MKIRRRKKRSRTSEIADEVSNEAKAPVEPKIKLRFDKVVSTGSTLLDLSISGKRIRGGGLPAGILAEFYGPSASGKSSVLASICSSAQRKGGLVRLRDPEARMDEEYATIYGINFSEEVFDYARPDTVLEFFTDLWTWKYENEAINVFGGDSVAALSTQLEMENEEGDKRGQKQAKEFSQNLRKSARIIGGKNILAIFNNQVRQGENGETRSGGRAMEFYASLIVRIGKMSGKDGDIKKEIKLKSGKSVEKIIGIQSMCYVKKSTVDDPYRSCPLSIVFGYGIDTVRDELQYYKDLTKETTYNCFDKTYQSLEKAIQYVEEFKFQKRLRNRTIDLWEEVESKFKIERKPKVWF